MSFFRQLFFGTSKEQEQQQQSEANNKAPSGTKLEPKSGVEGGENDDASKPKGTPTMKAKEEDAKTKKARKKRSKDKDKLIGGPVATTPTLTPTAHSPVERQSDGSTKRKKLAKMLKRIRSPEVTSKDASQSAGHGHSKDGKTKKARSKKPKKGRSLPGRRLRISDDIFPEELRATGNGKHHSSRPRHRHPKPSKSLPAVADQRSVAQDTTVTESPSAKEHLKKKKKKVKPKSKVSKKDKTPKNADASVETETTEQPPPAEIAAATTPPLDTGLQKKEKIEEIPEPLDAKDLPEIVRLPILDREEINKLIADLKTEDKEIPKVIHDPWLPLSELMARSNDFYSEKRARNNAAITYEKFVDYELCSTKENKDGPNDSKKNVSINPKIERDHFDVTTGAAVGKDSTPVIDHTKDSKNHPDK